MATVSNSSYLTQDFITSFLRNYDDQYAMTILPATLFLVILMLIGLTGNTLVCFVYFTKIKKGTTTRSFIISLAILDLINCVISMPFEIVDMRYHYTFGDSSACGLMKLFETFTSVTSGSVLLAVAADRYNKICQPFKPQMTTRVAIFSVVICCVLSLIVAVPSGFLYGARKRTTDDININGTDCSLSDKYIGTIYHFGYLGFLFLLFFGVTISLVVLYTLIWKQVVHQRKYKRALSTHTGTQQEVVVIESPGTTETSPSTSEGMVSFGTSLKREETSMTFSTSVVSEAADVLEDQTNQNKASTTSAMRDERNMTGLIPVESVEKPAPVYKGTTNTNNDISNKDTSEHKPASHPKVDPVTSSSEKMTRRMTFILFLVTLAFVVSFLPHLCLILLASAKRRIIEGLKGGSFIAFQIFQRSYFFQSVSNPIIYSFCNPGFRRELKLLAKRRRCA